MPIYIAQFAIVEENRWFSHTPPYAEVRQSRQYRIATHMFAAIDPEAAYKKAVTMVDGFSDSHNDGPGDRTNFVCIGLAGLEEVQLSGRTLDESLNEPYGVDAGLVDLGSATPKVSRRDELSLFHVPPTQSPRP